MDTLLVKGDHYTDSRGIPVAVEGDLEVLQRALLRLQIRKGAFALEPGLGSELHRLRRGSAENLQRLAASYVQEALAPQGEIRVLGVRVASMDDTAALVAVDVGVGGGEYQLEVKIT